MSKKNSGFMRGMLMGIGIAAIGNYGYKAYQKYTSSGKKKKPQDMDVVRKYTYSYDNIRNQIKYVCKALKMNEKKVMEKFFSHVENEADFTVDTSKFRYSDVARYIDHTVLSPKTTEDGIKKLCEEAKKFKFASVCVNGCRVKYCHDYLNDVQVAAVIGFPLGSMTTDSKVFETKKCYQDGAEEIDMVINVGKLKDGKFSYTYKDIKAVVEVNVEKVVKVILETCFLTPNEIILGSIISVLAGAKYVKTSTGFGGGGAKFEHITLMKKTVGNSAKIKASGGIRTYEDALVMIGAGASRLGCSSSVNIVTGRKPVKKGNY